MNLPFKLEVPRKCDLCEQFQTQVIYDAVVKHSGGAWAWMCQSCWEQHALWKRLGTGIGQKYIKNAHGMWEKVPYVHASKGN